MVAARFDAGFEFLHGPVKNRSQLPRRRQSKHPQKARREAGCEVQGNLEEPELTVVGRFAV